MPCGGNRCSWQVWCKIPHGSAFPYRILHQESHVSGAAVCGPCVHRHEPQFTCPHHCCLSTVFAQEYELVQSSNPVRTQFNICILPWNCELNYIVVSPSPNLLLVAYIMRIEKENFASRGPSELARSTSDRPARSLRRS